MDEERDLEREFQRVASAIEVPHTPLRQSRPRARRLVPLVLSTGLIVLAGIVAGSELAHWRAVNTTDTGAAPSASNSIGVLPSGSAGPTSSPASTAPPAALPAFTGAASGVSGLRTNALGELRGNWIFVGRWVGGPQTATVDVQIWAIPLSGGAPKPAFAYQAPSGGVPEAILDNAPYLRRQFSPDGRQFVVSVGAQLVIVDLPTGQVRRLGIAGYFPSWSKDGSEIAFLAEKPAASGAATPDHVIRVIPVTGGATRELLNIGSGTNGVEWSADGAQLLVAAADGISIVDARSGTLIRHLAGASASGSSMAYWRAASSQVALIESACGQGGLATTRIAVLDNAGASERVVLDTKETCSTISLSDPRWNPAGGSQVLYVVAKIAAGTADFELHLLDATSGTDMALPLKASEATWTWDGQQIAYLEKTTTQSPYGQSLHLASRDGRSDQVVLGEDGSVLFSIASVAY